ncbi:uncharacterized protein LOC120158052 [Hibiscus syriacus]|uniref:uncharacterized protein LOC120158052 n=1 Tax=Hibiscus syriacus TaxID=106335 RepID=UPI001921A2FF|nr:uncharacterized protein LOC120158052 [Hibiscus syriacus]
MALAWLNKEAHINRPKPLKFFNFWSNHPNFLEEVTLSWQHPIYGNPMHALFLKLKRLKPCLQALNNNFYSNLSARVNLKKLELEQVQIYTLKGINPLDKEMSIQNKLDALEEAENIFLKQKTKVKWLKEGYKCTKYFHSVMATKNKNGTIRVLINAQEKRLDSFEDMSTEVLDFFKSQLGTADPNLQHVDPQYLKRDDFIKATIFFFQEASILPVFNYTIISLIPKLQNPSTVKDYRPISCCSVVYKTISKILFKRLNKLLPEVISPNQSAFVRGRTIIDNTLIAQELVKGYGRKQISPRCALKIDLQKAFDSLH